MLAEGYILILALTLGSHYLFQWCNYLQIDREEVADKTCSICLEDLKNVRFICRTRCNHYYCADCLQDWLSVKQVCPMCNMDLG